MSEKGGGCRDWEEASGNRRFVVCVLKSLNVPGARIDAKSRYDVRSSFVWPLHVVYIVFLLVGHGQLGECETRETLTLYLD
jgi:hypothetical protein